MSQDYNNPAFKKLLKKLQEESWQLELLISGFAIFGLFTAFPEISDSLREAQNRGQSYKLIIYLVAKVSCGILIFNLIFHVLLRGLWIGALGLRYVSGDIEYDKLNYSKRFTTYLQKKVGSFDRYIARLENYCSIIFAISFLLIFYVLAITFSIVTIAIIGNFIISSTWLPYWIAKGLGIPLMLFVAFGMFITFIDFISMGYLKKKKWISKVYFPIYWVFSYITLSFLYRPLVYNFLDHKFGRRLSFVLVPFYILVLILNSFYYQSSNYINASVNSSEIMANSENYEDLIGTTDKFIGDVTIQSKVITASYLKVFMLYTESIEDRVFAFNPTLQPEKDVRGLRNDVIRFGKTIKGSEQDSLRMIYLKTINHIYSIKIDSINYASEFILTENSNQDLGFETYITTDSLDIGKHILTVKGLAIREKDTLTSTVTKIPFWYYKD